MPSSYTTEIPVELQAAGENLNTWGAPKLNNALTRITKAIAGYVAVALTGNRTLTTSNSSTTPADFEAYQSLIKFTGSLSSAPTVTIPSLAKAYLFWNATNVAVTISTGAGSTVSLPSGGKVCAFCDGSAVYELGYSNLGLKDYIDAAVLGATGSLPAVTGNAGKLLYCDGVTWYPKLLVVADISDYSTAAASDIWAGTSSTKVVTPAALQNANASQALTDASTVTMNLANGPNATWQLTSAVGGSRTMAAPTNCAVNDFISLKVVQPASGGPCTVTWDACFDWMANGTPTLSAGASKEDMVWGQVVAVDGSNVATKIKAVFGLAA